MPRTLEIHLDKEIINHGDFALKLNYTVPYDYVEVDLVLYVENIENSKDTSRVSEIRILLNTNTKMVLNGTKIEYKCPLINSTKNLIEIK